MPEATARLIQMPNRLKDRVSGQTDGLSFEEILAKSAAIVTALTGEWRIGALCDLSELTRLAGEMHADPPGMGALLPAFFSLTHGIQGQAGTFGYGEVSYVAASLCDYLADLDAAGGNIGEPRRHLAVLDRHLAQLRRLLIDDIRDTTVNLRHIG
ncbi:MAG: hypothetical protein FJX60_10395 [Alphaproteobacteria bacterium]|nr:hypothetical protein [Alphaproteobacteria bacterium]